MGQDSASILQSLEQAPDGALIVQRYNERLAEEARRREAFYNDIDESVKAEFINGKIVMHSPVTRGHSSAVGNFAFQLMNYVRAHDLGEVHIEKAMIRLTRNDYEPDICFFSTEKTAIFTDDQTLFPPPDLVVEVLSPSTAKVYRGIKFVDYAAHGVGEYWIVDPKKKIVEQYINRDGKFQLLFRSKDQPMRSTVVEGFILQAGEVFK